MMDRTFFPQSAKTFSAALAGLLCLPLAIATHRVQAAPPSVKDALKLTPVQDDVAYQQVNPSEFADCSVEDIEIDGWSGWEVLDANGSMLRRFADTNRDKKIDLWCYFDQGVEVYRDIDSDGNGKADQYRWLGTAGTRWAVDKNEDGKIDMWKQISAEEVTAELVNAIRDGVPEAFTRLLATPSDLRESGVGKEQSDALVARMTLAAKQFSKLAKNQKAIGPDAQWVQFAAPTPGVVPSGTNGATKDIVVYENVVAMYDEDGKPGQMLVGSMIQVGSSWRLLGLPSIGNDGQAPTQTAGVFFTPAGGLAGMPMNPAADEATQALVTQLEKIDRQLQTASDKDAPSLHAARADLVEKLIGAAGNTTDRETWTRQLVDTVSVATQGGKYPEGLTRLKKVATTYARGNKPLAAYAEFQAITTEYQLKGSAPKANFQALQGWYLETLEKFADQYSGTLESAQAMLQLALSKEFEEKEREALGYYKRVANEFASTPVGKKAAGAASAT